MQKKQQQPEMTEYFFLVIKDMFKTLSLSLSLSLSQSLSHMHLQ